MKPKINSCGSCAFIAKNPLDVGNPNAKICLRYPPTGYAVPATTPLGKQMMVTFPVYAPVGDDYPACGEYCEANKLVSA